MNRWVKTIGGFVAAALLLTAFAGVAMAQGPTGWGDSNGVPNTGGARAGHGYGFVDEDGDGINDRNDEDCDGVPNYDGKGTGRGYGFVDEDGDGINDRCDEDCDGVPDFSRNGRFGGRGRR